GKSTLLRALAGLAPRTSGPVLVAGLDPMRTPRPKLAREVGFVGQHAEDMFVCASAREELSLGPRHLRGRADPLALEGLARHLGLAASLDRHPLSLSGGERQRLALACALAHGPRILLLDEPTVGMDAQGVTLLAAALEPVRMQGAVLIATHDEALLPLADEVVQLRDGKLARARKVPA
ncbi:MAG: energy-coupling factor ABC transporter ATP-binding protein, partial [Halobacteriales archaeon]|nr:energy-coupling factor ABC transporter ATP-binding protein [Halobacteriales archaeon]